MARYRDLRAWRAAHEMAVEVYKVTECWRPAERYGLTAQVRRAAFSAPSNIAEGSMRRGAREFRRFLDVALGSIAEVEYTLEFAEAVGVALSGDRDRLAPMIANTGRLTYRLARSLDAFR